MAAMGFALTDVKSMSSASSDTRGAIFRITLTVSFMGTENTSTSHSAAARSGVIAVLRPTRMISRQWGLKISENQAPMRPVPPITATFGFMRRCSLIFKDKPVMMRHRMDRIPTIS